jgi:uncharacterized membrane protein SpoIIM required for sporulation
VSGRPIRGFFAGLMLGLGVAILLIVFAVIALGTLTPYIIVVVGVVLGTLLGMFNERLPWRGGSSSSGISSGSGPAPGAGAPPA